MKILQVNVVYKRGSTGSIVAEIHKYLKSEGIESVVCYGRGKKNSEKDVYKVCSEIESKICHFLSYVFGITDIGFLFSTAKLERIIKKEKPDVVHLHCLNGYYISMYRLLNWLKKSRIKVVLTLHAEFMYTGGCAYSVECEKWRNGENCIRCEDFKRVTGSLFFNRTGRIFKRLQSAFEDFGDNIHIVSVSPWLISRAKSSPILKKLNHTTVLNGIDTSVFKPCDTANLKNRLGLKTQKIVFHPTANFSDKKGHIKGGHYLIQLARALKDKNIKFLVAGIYEEGIKVPDNVVLLGRLNNQQELAHYYSMADLTVLTSLRETFSMVVAESLCCGTPVVGFKAGAPEQIAIKEYSEFVDTKNSEKLKCAVLGWINKSKDEKLPPLAKQKYESTSMCKNYKDIYCEML